MYKINEQKECFTKEIKILKKNQEEIWELKDSINEMKNVLESIGNTANHIEKRISELEHRNIAVI